MATKKKQPVTEPEQAVGLEDALSPEELGQEGEPLLEGEELPKLVYYRVNWHGGVSLRTGPGVGYLRKTVLPFGMIVLGEDVADLLREDRGRGNSAWLHVTCEVDSGWIDGAYLERIDVPAE